MIFVKIIGFVFLLILLFLVLTLILLIFMKSSVIISMTKKKGERAKYKISLRFFGGIIKKDFDGIKKRKKEKDNTKENKDDSDKSFIEKAKESYITFKEIKKIYDSNKKRIRKSIYLKKIYASISFGLEDAAKTGIAIGGVWSAIFDVIAFLSNVVTVSKPQIEINPDYNGLLLEFDSEIMIEAKTFGLIVTALDFLIKYKKISKKRKGGD